MVPCRRDPSLPASPKPRRPRSPELARRPPSRRLAGVPARARVRHPPPRGVPARGGLPGRALLVSRGRFSTRGNPPPLGRIAEGQPDLATREDRPRPYRPPRKIRGVLPAVVAPPAARGRGAGARPAVTGPRAQARRAAPGAGAAGPLEPAAYGVGSVGHPARTQPAPTHPLQGRSHREFGLAPAGAAGAAATSVGRFPPELWSRCDLRI
jgi:hypothetical protein